jgi:hypothetical protein
MTTVRIWGFKRRTPNPVKRTRISGRTEEIGTVILDDNEDS